MTKLFYSESKDQLLELFDSDPEYFYCGSFKYKANTFIGEALIFIDQYGQPAKFPRTVPFGKFKGQTVESLSDDYLRWLGSIAAGPLKVWCIDEMIARFGSILAPRVRSYVDSKSDYEDAWAYAMDHLWDFGDN